MRHETEALIVKEAVAEAEAKAEVEVEVEAEAEYMRFLYIPKDNGDQTVLQMTKRKMSQ